MKKPITHAGALVPAQGRITFTRKRNGRYYIGCDQESFACILTSVMAQHRGSPVRPLPEHARPWEILEDQRLSLESSLEITAQSLTTYGAKYDHWAIAFSGGKDSSATVVAVVWLIRNGHIPAPKSITVLLSDTRMELPPLFITAMKLLVVGYFEKPRET